MTTARRRLSTVAWLTALIVLGGVQSARAQIDIAGLSSKREFTASERNRVRAWVDERVAALGRAKRPNDQKRARDDLIKPFEAEGATAQFRDLYGRECGRALAPLVGGPDFNFAHPLALLLLRMPVVGTADALLSAIQSPHAAVRYQAAKGLRALHAVLSDPAEYGPVLDALSQAGIAESEPIVVEAIYRAIDFSDVKGFTGADAVARALIPILRSRFLQLETRSRHEVADIPAFQAIASVFPKTTEPDLRHQVAWTLARFLRHYSRRYTELGVTGGGASLLAPIDACERALEAVAKSAEGSPPPRDRVAAQIRAKADHSKVLAALAGWIGEGDKSGTLNGAPWNLPRGLSEK